MTHPKISVIMPVYNTCENYLREAIDSILNQTFRDFEFIIINDGSTNPETEKVIQSYTDSRIKYFYKPNSGIIGALNYAIEKTSGEFTARMDSDDIALPQRFQAQIDFFEKHPDISILGTWMQTFGDSETIIKPLENVDFMAMLKECCLAHPTVMWRTNDFEKYRFRYDPEYKYAEDYELWSRAVRFLKIANIPEPLLRYRFHSLQITNKHMTEMRQTAKRVQKNMLEFLTRNEEMRQTIEHIIFPKEKWIGIPLIKIKYGATKTIWNLFGFLPLMVFKHTKNKTIWRLFGIAPIFVSKNR